MSLRITHKIKTIFGLLFWAASLYIWPHEERRLLVTPRLSLGSVYSKQRNWKRHWEHWKYAKILGVVISSRLLLFRVCFLSIYRITYKFNFINIFVWEILVSFYKNIIVIFMVNCFSFLRILLRLSTRDKLVISTLLIENTRTIIACIQFVCKYK